MRILAVDDEPAICTLLASILSREGHHVTAASSAVEALLHIRVDRPDLILLDIGLPGMDGHQLAQSLTTNDETFDIPIVVVSARDSNLDHSWARINGCRAYVEKPFVADDVLSAIRRIEGASGELAPLK